LSAAGSSGGVDPARPIVSVRGLTIEHVSGFRLLGNVDLDLSPGEVVILAGPSGSGKSTLVNLLAGTVDPDVDGWRLDGALTFHGNRFDLSRENVMVGGVIFQHFALFNELTVAQNLKIAADHNDPVSPNVQEAIDGLLAGIRRSNLVGACSGGQRQRVAIARTLLANHPVLFMDEPNSGLDVAATRRLAELIRTLSKEVGISVVIIAHHFRDLIGVTDRVLLLDPRSSGLRELETDADLIEDELRDIDEYLLSGDGSRRMEDHVVDSQEGWGTRHSSEAFRRTVRPPRQRVDWTLFYLGRYVWEHCFAPSSLLFSALGSVIIGFVTTWFIFQYLPFRELLLPIIHSDTLAGLAFTELRVLAPLVTSVLLITRNAALIGADIGQKVHSDQIKAMRNLNIPYRLYITSNIIAASVVATIVLVTLSVCVTAWVAMMTWAYIFPDDSTYLWRDQYFQRLWPPGTKMLDGVDWITVKSIPSVIGATGIALWLGYRPKQTVADINDAIAKALIWGMSFVLVWQTVLILIEFRQVSARLEATF
jgi:ABC-type multidrug transport system ATPase subunit/ABC-type transporter Mla maintaining outer membrane lipid asymmetry permease subunit MlaE